MAGGADYSAMRFALVSSWELQERLRSRCSSVGV